MGCQYLGLPDGYPVLGRQIHAIAFGDAVEIQELIKLLQGAVDAQVFPRYTACLAFAGKPASLPRTFPSQGNHPASAFPELEAGQGVPLL